MAMPTGRSDKRITEEMAVGLFVRMLRSSPRDAVATEHVWRPGGPHAAKLSGV